MSIKEFFYNLFNSNIEKGIRKENDRLRDELNSLERTEKKLKEQFGKN